MFNIFLAITLKVIRSNVVCGGGDGDVPIMMGGG